MIVELGHFALILALMVALVQSTLPLVGRAGERCAADGAGGAGGADPAGAGGGMLWGADLGLCRLGLLAGGGGVELAHAKSR